MFDDITFLMIILLSCIIIGRLNHTGAELAVEKGLDTSGWEIGQSFGPYLQRTKKKDIKPHLGRSIRHVRITSSSSSSSPGATQPTVVVYFTALYRVLASSRTSYLITHSDSPQPVVLL